jgi:hypothetical protein
MLEMVQNGASSVTQQQQKEQLAGSAHIMKATPSNIDAALESIERTMPEVRWPSRVR